jgi:hypothetical protein
MLNRLYKQLLKILFCFFLIVQIDIHFLKLQANSEPVIFFSDLTYAPKTGWECSSTKGAAITIWGEGFGNEGYNGVTNYVSVGGVMITEYAEWGEGLGPARNLDRITFWLHSGVPSGTTFITVTVNGVTSNEIPLVVGPATIYFVSVTDGDNSYNGLYSTYQGGNNGPFRDIKMFNPAYNPSGWEEPFIVYVRGGVYTEQDIEGTFVALKAPPTSPDTPRALIGYPCEEPVLDMDSLQRAAIWSAAYSPYKLSYSLYTIAKLKFINGKDAILLIGGHDNRFIGNVFAYNNKEAWSGVIMVREANHQYIYGNYFYKNGYDSYKHEIYVKTHAQPPGIAEYVYIGWNEFENWTADLNPNDTISRGGAIFVSTASDAFNKGITNHVYIHDNYFHGGDSEPFYNGNGGGKEIYIYNNIFADIIPEVERGIYFGAGTAPGMTNIYFYNNTLYNVADTGSPMILVTGDSVHVISKNNIFYAKQNQSYLKVEPYLEAKFISENDLYYGNPELPSGQGVEITNPITSDPLFVDTTVRDFHLQAGSPAIDTALTLTEVDHDFDGNIRPIDGDDDGIPEPDLGAYEYLPPGSVGETYNEVNLNIRNFYPNPFTSKTVLIYYIPRKSKVVLNIYNVSGEKVRTLVNKLQTSGEKYVVWYGKDDKGKILPSGVYFYKLKNDFFIKRGKIIFMKK